MAAEHHLLRLGAFVRRGTVTGVLVAVLLSAVGCSGSDNAGRPTVSTDPVPSAGASGPAAVNPAPTAAPTGIRLLGPDAPVTIDRDPVAVVVEVLESGKPKAGLPVTFTVESGPARFPGGFEATLTDETGVAVATTLEPSAAGTVTLRVTSGERIARVKVTLLGARP